MAGLRARKKEQTRRRIADVALSMFAERGFEAVTVNQIAEAAEVARATMFAYFPTKEALVLDGVGAENLSTIVERREPGQSFLDALRAHYEGLASAELTGVQLDSVTTRMRVIRDSPALRNAANTLLYQQRDDLARSLVTELGESAARFAAAQVAAALLTLQESYFERLLDGVPPRQASTQLAEEVDLAFDLLRHGLHRRGEV